jgi:hypothetical protein
MNYFLAQIILAAGGDGDDTVWIQLLVLVVLAVGVGVFSLVKTRTRKFEEQEPDYPEEAGSPPQRRWRWQFQPLRGHVARGEAGTSVSSANKRRSVSLKRAQAKTAVKEPVLDFAAAERTRGRKRDLASGMEILELDLVLSIVENTKGNGKNEVMMRRLNFNELLRRGKLVVVDSKSLKVYAKNEGNRYGKDVQCEAMKILVERTGHKSKRGG